MRWLAVAILVAYALFWFWISQLSSDRGDSDLFGGLAVILAAALVLAPLTYGAWRRPRIAWVFVTVGLLLALFWWLFAGWWVANSAISFVVFGLWLGGPPLLAGLLFLAAGRLDRVGDATTRSAAP